jgi:hypothetical protein
MAGLTQDQLGARLYVSGSYIGAVERAKETCVRDLAVRADTELETQGEPLTHLWDGTMKGGAYPSWFDWPIYEAKATALRAFQLSVVDGLLQTADYARALLRGDEAAVEARMSRQNVLSREESLPPLLVCVMDESVLRREVGDPKVMRDQLEHLVGVVSARVSVHIVPSVAHDGISGSFVLATLDDRSEVAYVETAAHGLTTGEPKNLRTLTEAFELIRSRALPVDMSMDLITRTAEERWT